MRQGQTATARRRRRTKRMRRRLWHTPGRLLRHSEAAQAPPSQPVLAAVATLPTAGAAAGAMLWLQPWLS